PPIRQRDRRDIAVRVPLERRMKRHFPLRGERGDTLRSSGQPIAGSLAVGGDHARCQPRRDDDRAVSHGSEDTGRVMDELTARAWVLETFLGSREDFPFGPAQRVFKNARGKMFVLMSDESGSGFRITMKLGREEAEEARMLP